MSKDILEMRDRAKKELFVLFGKKPEEITESMIMYMVGLYTTDVDTVGLAIEMMNKELFECPITGEDKTEYSEEEKAQRRWEQTKQDRLK
jgi:hypothetical protein